MKKSVGKPHGTWYLVKSTWYKIDFAIIKSKYYVRSKLYYGLRLASITKYELTKPEVHVNLEVRR